MIIQKIKGNWWYDTELRDYIGEWTLISQCLRKLGDYNIFHFSICMAVRMPLRPDVIGRARQALGATAASDTFYCLQQFQKARCRCWVWPQISGDSRHQISADGWTWKSQLKQHLIFAIWSEGCVYIYISIYTGFWPLSISTRVPPDSHFWEVPGRGVISCCDPRCVSDAAHSDAPTGKFLSIRKVFKNDGCVKPTIDDQGLVKPSSPPTTVI